MWIHKLHFGQNTVKYATNFKNMGVEGEDLDFIDEETLDELGIEHKLHRHKILRKIRSLQGGS